MVIDFNKYYSEDDKDFEEYDNALFEMTTVCPKHTGLDYKVWIRTLMPGNEKRPKQPHLLVEIDDKLITVSISDNPQILIDLKIEPDKFSKIRKWILKNKEMLVKCYTETMGSFEMIEQIKKL